jgi:hypothetical protein
MTIRTSRPSDYKKTFTECPSCGLSIHNRSYREHMAEHGEVDTSHGRGGGEKGPDPLPVRIENLKKVIERVKGRAQTKANRDLLAQYESGMVELVARLPKEQK